MTERMKNALNHIKTSVDVDPWAVEEVERVFEGIDDAIAEIDKEIDAYRDGGSGNELVIFGLIQAKAIIEEYYMEIGDTE